MSSQQPRSYTRIAAAIVVAAVILAVTIFATTNYSTTVTRTIPQITTSIATTTVIGAATVPSGSRLYEVTFKQSGDCTPTAYAAPWSVTLGPWTVAEPSNASLPINTSIGSASPSYVNFSAITFSVPNGEYQYNITVGWNFGNPSGVINVNGADVMVLLQGPAISCTTTTV